MKLKTARCVLLSLTLVVGLVPFAANAYCPGSDKSTPEYDPKYYSVSHEFRRSQYVVRARVIRETWLGDDGKEKRLEPPFQNGAQRPWGFDPYVGAYYDIEVLKAFKGKPGDRLRIFSENTTARFWLNVGGEYLFFVTKEKFDEPVGLQLTIDTCGNSASFEKGNATFRAVERLSQAR